MHRGDKAWRSGLIYGPAYWGRVVTLDLAQLGLRLDVQDAPADADVEVLPNGLEAFNESRWPGHQKWRPLAVFARERETIVAGLAGETYSGWLFIRYLWVSDALRGKGIGPALMDGAETRALERGCHSAWVDTFSFQAPGFYRRLGYEPFGELDYPPDFKRIFLQKRLLPRSGGAGTIDDRGRARIGVRTRRRLASQGERKSFAGRGPSA
jgi:GNAT superfamily N-acetyltransferase